MLSYMYIYFLVIMFFSGLFVYVSKYKHFLLMLLSLEFMVLSVFMFLMVYFSYFFYEYFMGMFFLTMSVCESVLGLSLLILIIRSHGSDSVAIFDSLW
uniref:NADH-ubiquinone oxidoreductase chain 4L n=1 Tax=Trigonopterus carinirostris TaxID=2576104 RepID=A0A7H1KI14_9CUCU|nr:NADH dehydrogenase subunit 4L [Trigonopterus carinirostris]QNT26930.1 NADH dehydrogenase subunit 4L [Trigonopterus carinirostris]